MLYIHTLYINTLPLSCSVNKLANVKLEKNEDAANN